MAFRRIFLCLILLSNNLMVGMDTDNTPVTNPITHINGRWKIDVANKDWFELAQNVSSMKHITFYNDSDTAVAQECEDQIAQTINKHKEKLRSLIINSVVMNENGNISAAIGACNDLYELHCPLYGNYEAKKELCKTLLHDTCSIQELCIYVKEHDKDDFLLLKDFLNLMRIPQLSLGYIKKNVVNECEKELITALYNNTHGFTYLNLGFVNEMTPDCFNACLKKIKLLITQTSITSATFYTNVPGFNYTRSGRSIIKDSPMIQKFWISTGGLVWQNSQFFVDGAKEVKSKYLEQNKKRDLTLSQLCLIEPEPQLEIIKPTNKKNSCIIS